MIAIILAGGYARRLWPLTLDKPKALLTLGGKTVLDHIIEKILVANPPVQEIIVSTNMRFNSQFQEWARERGYSDIKLVPDSSTSELDKMGAIGALNNIVSCLDDPLLVLAGDSIFEHELDGLLRYYEAKKSPVVAIFKAQSPHEARRGATATLNDGGVITSFTEKPENPKTTLIGACIYAFPERIGLRLEEYLRLGFPRDEPGRFIEWLHKIERVYGYPMEGTLLDIGTIESYREAEKHFDLESARTSGWGRCE